MDNQPDDQDPSRPLTLWEKLIGILVLSLSIGSTVVVVLLVLRWLLGG